MNAEAQKIATQNPSRGSASASARPDLQSANSDLRSVHAAAALATSSQELETDRAATQKIEARFERVRARILAQEAFFAKQGVVETTWRTYRGRRLGPYYRVSCRQRRVRCAPSVESGPQQTSIYLGRSEELAARVRRLLEELRQDTHSVRCYAELRRQIGRSLARAKEELRQLLAVHGVTLKGFEFRGAAQAFGRLPTMSQLRRSRFSTPRRPSSSVQTRLPKNPATHERGAALAPVPRQGKMASSGPRTAGIRGRPGGVR